MQTVEEFLGEVFRDRTELIRRTGPGWESHRQRFFAPHYEPYPRSEAAADSEAERIIAIRGVGDSTEVITTGSAGGRWRFRYRLAVVDGRWRIETMEMECSICRGSGKAGKGDGDCRLCSGAGWKLVGRTRHA